MIMKVKVRLKSCEHNIKKENSNTRKNHPHIIFVFIIPIYYNTKIYAQQTRIHHTVTFRLNSSSSKVLIVILAQLICDIHLDGEECDPNKTANTLSCRVRDCAGDRVPIKLDLFFPFSQIHYQRFNLAGQLSPIF